MHMVVVLFVSDSRRQSLSVITHTHTHTKKHRHTHFEWYDTRRSLDSHSGWTADAILYIVRSLHHQVFLDNLHALHYLACTPKLLHFVCLEAVCSEQLFHRASTGWAGVTRAQLTTLAFKKTNPRSQCFISNLIWILCSGWKLSVKEIIVVSLHSQSWVQYSTFKHWHWYGFFESFFLYIYYLYALPIVLEYHFGKLRWRWQQGMNLAD